jgi:Holliday junction resolvasome RuvABC endonuclease subunit
MTEFLTAKYAEYTQVNGEYVNLKNRPLYVVLEGQGTLVDWAVKRVRGDMNAQSLKKVKELITHYQPDVLALEDVLAEGSRRAERIRELCKQVVILARTHGVKVKTISRNHVIQALVPTGQLSKQAVAEIMAQKFPVELGPILPAKRELWMSENSNMAIFDAAALAVVFRFIGTRRQAKKPAILSPSSRLSTVAGRPGRPGRIRPPA